MKSSATLVPIPAVRGFVPHHALGGAGTHQHTPNCDLAATVALQMADTGAVRLGAVLVTDERVLIHSPSPHSTR